MRSIIFKRRKNIGSLLWRGIKWHLNFYFTGTPTPLSCGLYLTNKCNFKCSFCNIWRKQKVTTLPYDAARKLVDDLSDMKCFYFSVTGGEPLLVPYVFDLLSYAKKSNISHVHLVTNGYLLGKAQAIRLRDTGIDEISISIDGREETHDTARGVRGAYRNALSAIEYMREHAPNVNIVLNAVLFTENPFECLHVVELAHQFGVFMKVQPLNQHPIFNKDNHHRIPSRDLPENRKQDFLDVIERLRNDTRVVNSDTFLKNIYNFYFRKDRLVFAASDCIFGYHHIEVLETGLVFPCLEGLNWENGVKLDADLKDIIRSDEYNRTLKHLRKCSGCRNNYYICYYEPRIAVPVANFIRFR